MLQSVNAIGLPLKKMPPQNEEDLLFKLTNTRFNSSKDMLNFFEGNRDLFSESATSQPFQIMFQRLLGFQFQEKKAQPSLSPDLLLGEPQFKTLL